MTTNVDWCADGSKITWGPSAGGVAQQTQTGTDSGLKVDQKRSQEIRQESGGAYSIAAFSSFSRAAKSSLKIGDFGVDFPSGNPSLALTVRVTPSDGLTSVNGKLVGTNDSCAGTAASPCEVNP